MCYLCEALIIFTLLLLNGARRITAVEQSGVDAPEIVKTTRKQMPTSAGIVLEGTSGMRKSCSRVQPCTALLRLP